MSFNLRTPGRSRLICLKVSGWNDGGFGHLQFSFFAGSRVCEEEEETYMMRRFVMRELLAKTSADFLPLLRPAKQYMILQNCPSALDIVGWIPHVFEQMGTFL